jgi:hypothetical protein
MKRDSAVTIRLPSALKRELLARARRERRSLSAQITAYLEREVAQRAARRGRGGKLLGLYEGARLPSDAEFAKDALVAESGLVERHRG